MQAILAVTLPFFALVLCGYLAARWRLLPESALPGLNGFVLFFALPCMLLRFGMNTPLLQLLNPVVLGVYLLAALAMVGLSVAGLRMAGVELRDAAFAALVAAFPNSGFMGVPLLTALLGAAAAGPVIGTLLVDLFVTSSLCLALAGLQGAGGATQAARQALRGALSNPLPWSIALGALLGLAGLRLPGPLDTVVRMLGDAATPVALFTIGAVLCRSERQARGSASWPQVLAIAALKLLLHPALVLALGLAARQLGAPITPLQLSSLVLAAALPSASNVSLLAERHGADNGRVARIILSSTVLAFASFSLAAWWLVPG
ncbi:AEC family transporter [Pelomonas sp. CA6]|uniref:AEC family transporter n=1 Tax=Pelomonas sp. CA6 TaxID=2907999 RepID=UPI001F4C298C|nr:AEC family transporter [Pelomonas sp. CA6]MCH7345654.1 AEC family transporter [Pelomonas sp. CA6]